MKYNLSSESKQFLFQNGNSGIDVVVASEQATEAYMQFIDLGVECSQISQILDNMVVSIEHLSEFGNNSVPVLNIDKGLEELLGLSEKDITSTIASETLGEKISAAFKWLKEKIRAMWKAIKDFFKNMYDKIFGTHSKEIKNILSAASKISEKEYKECDVTIRICVLKEKWTTNSKPCDFVIPMLQEIRNLISSINATMVYNIMNQQDKKSFDSNLMIAFNEKMETLGVTYERDLKTPRLFFKYHEVRIPFEKSTVKYITDSLDNIMKELKSTSDFVSELNTKIEDVTKSSSEKFKDSQPAKEDITFINETIPYLRKIVSVARELTNSIDYCVKRQRSYLEEAINECERKIGKSDITNFNAN